MMLKINELKKKDKEELIFCYKELVTSFNHLKKELERANKRWRDYYRIKSWKQGW